MAEKTIELPKKTYAIEFFVGLFAMAGLACFGYISINLAGLKLTNTGSYRIQAQFDNISGLKSGAPVEIAGVKVGSVSKLALDGINALVDLEIENKVQIRDDDIVAIRTKGIIGDKYIKIIPGGSEDYLTPGSQITDTESTVEFEEIISKVIHRME